MKFPTLRSEFSFRNLLSSLRGFPWWFRSASLKFFKSIPTLSDDCGPIGHVDKCTVSGILNLKTIQWKTSLYKAQVIGPFNILQLTWNFPKLFVKQIFLIFKFKCLGIPPPSWLPFYDIKERDFRAIPKDRQSTSSLYPIIPLSRLFTHLNHYFQKGITIEDIFVSFGVAVLGH